MVDKRELTPEEQRLKQDTTREKYWKRWGPYLSERQWATVREDYSANGDAWSYFPHDQARSRAYRWGEDGIAGFSDTHALQCYSFAFWNEKDDFLKERLFGLTGHEGNHGEDVKEEYFYIDSTPTHSYMNYQYKYPQKPYPYEELKEKNAGLDRLQEEIELVDTGVLDENRYFDIFVETAKDENDPEEISFRVTAYNQGPEDAPLHILPQVWFRNTWGWSVDPEIVKQNEEKKPHLEKLGDDVIKTSHPKFGDRYIQFQGDGELKLLFTENETNQVKLFKCEAKDLPYKYYKDGFHEYICNDNKEAVNPENKGTKGAAWFAIENIPSGQSATIRVKISTKEPKGPLNVDVCDKLMEDRLEEADEFYYQVSPLPISEELRTIQRQAFAGMMWNKQYYQFIWPEWAHGDKGAPLRPPHERINVRNKHWKHLHIDDVLSMPDKWEYPFFAAWDTAFHCIPIAMIDPQFAKGQLDLMTREWYMHPNGQLPAYEWNFSDVNPPVHAWSAFRVFKLERRMTGKEDLDFLERVFQKLLLNFTWWVNRKDEAGHNVFEGGFLGLDNIGLFNRSEPLPTGGVLEQADGTGWMGFYCLQMLNIALELSKHRSIYEDIATKFFEHFLFIADAMSHAGGDGSGLWDDEEGFFFDKISWGNGYYQKLPIRSLVGLIPLYASLTLDSEVLVRYPKFARRVEWFVKNRPELAARNIASLTTRGQKNRLLLSLVSRDRLERILSRMLDESEFLSDYGIRSMSRYHEKHPYSMEVNGQTFEVDYQPDESKSPMFGGNSNWRGPIWFPTNFLLIESLQRFYLFYGNDFKVKCPAKDGYEMNLAKVAENLQHRLIGLFTRNSYKEGRRPYNGGVDLFDFDDDYNDCYLYYEYFNPDTGRGLGTKHQCGWTGLVAKLIHDTGMALTNPKTFGDNPIEASKAFFDDVYEVERPRSKHHSHKKTALRRVNSTHRIVQNINTLLERYNIRDDELEEDLESSQVWNDNEEPSKDEEN